MEEGDKARDDYFSGIGTVMNRNAQHYFVTIKESRLQMKLTCCGNGAERTWVFEGVVRTQITNHRATYL